MQIVRPIPVVLEPGSFSEVCMRSELAALLFGILLGDTAIEVCSVQVKAKPLPCAELTLVDRTRFVGLPAALVPAGAMITIMVKAKRRVSGELEILLWQDLEAPRLLELAGARSGLRQVVA